MCSVNFSLKNVCLLFLCCLYNVYSCFEKGCPPKPYATMWKSNYHGFIVMDFHGSLIVALGVLATYIERNSTNKCSYAFSFLVAKNHEPQSINVKLFLPIIPIKIVAYAFVLQLLSKQLYSSYSVCRVQEHMLTLAYEQVPTTL